MSKTTLQVLFRVGIGALSAVLLALAQYLEGVDLSELGAWTVIAGLVVTGIAWGLGKVVNLLPKPGA